MIVKIQNKNNDLLYGHIFDLNSIDNLNFRQFQKNIKKQFVKLNKLNRKELHNIFVKQKDIKKYIIIHVYSFLFIYNLICKEEYEIKIKFKKQLMEYLIEDFKKSTRYYLKERRNIEIANSSYYLGKKHVVMSSKHLIKFRVEQIKRYNALNLLEHFI